MDPSATWGTIITSYVLPSLGIVLSFALYGACFPTVYRARCQQKPESLDAVTLAMQFVNAILWLIYSIVIQDWFLWFSNAPGLLLTLFYVSTVLTLSSEKGSSAKGRYAQGILGIGACLLLIESCLLGFVFKTAEAQHLVAGLASNIWLALMYSSPTLQVGRACRQRDASMFVVPLVAITLLNSFMWTGYGLFGCNDPFLYLPNMMGIIASLVQVIVILMFHKTQAPRSVKDHTAGETHLLASPLGREDTALEFAEELPSPVGARVIVNASFAMMEGKEALMVKPMKESA